jgi:hypothetical protein
MMNQDNREKVEDREEFIHDGRGYAAVAMRVECPKEG